MHNTALQFGKYFFDTYSRNKKRLNILDIGSKDFNGSLRSFAPMGANYVGVDFEDGKGVDVLITDPYKLPFETNSIDIIVSSSCFEHSDCFWLVFLECLRLLKPSGILYINAPSNGPFHRYPVDSWRFYPDAGLSLESFGQRSGFDCALMESFVDSRHNKLWNDFVAVFIKDQTNVSLYPLKIIHSFKHFKNAHLYGTKKLIKPSPLSPELILLDKKEKEIIRLNSMIENLREGKSIWAWEIKVLIRKLILFIKNLHRG
jgi:SAM-dependent methyltransferase